MHILHRPSAVLCALLAIACSSDATGPGPDGPAVESVTVAPGTLNLVVGADGTFQVELRGGGQVLSGRTVTWTSLNTDAVAVVGAGIVRGLAPGTAEIRATSEGQFGTATVTVVQPLPVLSGAAPGSAPAGSSDLVVRLTGSGFVPESTARWNDSPRPTAFVSAAALDVTIPATDLSVLGQGELTVSNPAPGGGVSVAFLFQITTPGGTPNQWMVVASGLAHSCALTIEGKAYCWGVGSNGRLGDGSPAGDPRTTPTPVASDLSFTAISAGNWHSCAIAAGGDLWCWGSNEHGQIGNDGSPADFPSPQLVSGGLEFAQVSAGPLTTCGVTTTGAGYCWGEGSFGKLGNGSTAGQSTPQPVLGGLHWRSISAGNLTTCGVTDNDLAFCWGFGGEGQIGDGTFITTNTTPFLVGGGHAFANVTAPGPVGRSVCGVTTAGVGYCWGSGAEGQLGTGTTANRSLPALISGGLSFSGAAATSAHGCGVTVAGAAYCWGFGGSGRLGNGATENHLTPVPVSGNASFSRVALGQNHVCGLTTTGTILCWGAGAGGVLGNNAQVDQLIPAPVGGI